MTMKEKVAHVKKAQQTRGHTCHWPGCKNQVPPAMWGCMSHWFRIPKALRDNLWLAYRVGQEDRFDPSVEYLAAANEIQAWIKTKVGK